MPFSNWESNWSQLFDAKHCIFSAKYALSTQPSRHFYDFDLLTLVLALFFRFYYPNKALALLASPVTACLIMFKTVHEYIDVYNWHATNQSLFYSVYALLFFPHWLQIWAVTNGKLEDGKEAYIKEKKEQ